MQVLIINAHSPQYNPEKRVMLAPLYLGAVLKQNGHHVRVLDVEKDKVNLSDAFHLVSYWQDRLEPVLKDLRPALVGISVHYSGVFNCAIDIARLIKGYDSRIRLVMGGQHPTIFASLLMERYPEIDFVLKGESEETFCQLVSAIEHGADCTSIDGLCFRMADRVVENPKENFISNIDSLPFPDYTLVKLEEYHFDTSRWFNPKKHTINMSFPLLTSRSCPNRCTFCSMFLVQGPKFRMRSAENVVDEIEFLYYAYNQKYFSIVDDNFTLNRKRIIRICELIRQRGLDIQFDTTNGMEINHVSVEIMDALIDAGFLRTFFAMESGSEYIRTQVMKKLLPQRKIYEAFDVLSRYHGRFEYNVLFIIGFPQETSETLEETRKVIQDLDLKKVAIGFAIPYPGTVLYEEVEANNLFTVPKADLLENPDLFNFSKTPLIKPYRLDPEDLVRFRRQVYEEVNVRHHHKTDFGYQRRGETLETDQNIG
jgi:anaerobic magnesium-protoporphyrin IX monomethyl ester cyclase